MRLLTGATWLVIAGAITWTYAWMASGGTWHYPSSSGTYAEWLADAFLAGQIHLLIEPKPELLALPDPYDQAQSAPYRLPDASLFNGKYYLYFGPVPGLIHAAWRLATGGRIEESAMQLVAAVGGCFWFLLLARRLRALAFPRLAPAWANLAALCYALGGVSLYMVARTIGHHEQILVGSFFVLGGYYFWLRGLEGGRLALLSLFMGGLFLGLAFGSRHTLIGYPLACGLVMLGLWLRAPRDRLALSRLVAYGIAPTICVVLHMAYNAARFGSPLDFGVNYVLTGIVSMDAKSNFLGVLTLNYVWRNLEAYLAYVPTFIVLFPFQVPVQTLPISFINQPNPGWYFEPPMFGVPLVAPLTLFIPFSLLLLSRRWRGTDTAMLVPWFIASAAGGLVIPAMVAVFQVAATARYLQDILPVATILGAVGLWWLRARAASAIGRSTVGALAAVVLVLSVTTGGILGLSELSWDKPIMYARLTYAFDRAVTDVLRITQPSSWQDTYFFTTRGRLTWASNLGPFYIDGTENHVNTAPGDTTIRSVRAVSMSDEPMRMVVELNGVQVADEWVFPGPQTMFLDEPFPIDPAKRVTLQLRFPDLPAEPPGSLRPVALYNATSQPDFAVAVSHMRMLDGLREQAEEDMQVPPRLLDAWNAETRQMQILDAAMIARTAGPDAHQRLAEIEARRTALDQAYREAAMKSEQSTARYHAELRHIQEKEARANAARTQP